MSKSIILDIIKNSKKNKEIIGIWKYNDNDGFWAGYVTDYNEELVTIKHFTKYGKSDGTIIERIENIKNIDFKDDYAKAMQYIVENSEELDKDADFEIKLSNSEDWQEEILKQLEGTNQITKIEISNDGFFSGFITKVSESDFILHCIGEMGEDEGTVVYRIEDVTAIRVNDIENRKRAMLFEWRKFVCNKS
jgi:hypothetical protein